MSLSSNTNNNKCLNGKKRSRLSLGEEYDENTNVDENINNNHNQPLNKRRKLNSNQISNQSPECHICKKIFSSKSSLTAHIKRVHKKTKDYICTYSDCDKAFSAKGDLKRHVNNVHKKIKNYQCPHCDHKCAEKHHMKTHIETHSNNRVKDHKCTYSNCNKAYFTKSELTQHLKIHNNERNHKCDECDSKFYKKHTLQEHIKTVHRNEKNFECDECDKKFARAHGLKKHKAATHMDWKDDPNSTKKPRKTTKKQLKLKKKKQKRKKTRKNTLDETKMDVDKPNENTQQSKQIFLKNTLENAVKEGYFQNHDDNINGIYKIKRIDFQINLNANKLSNNTKINNIIKKIENIQKQLSEKIKINTEKAIECAERFSASIYLNKDHKDEWNENKVVHPPTMIKTSDIVDLYQGNKYNQTDKTIVTTFYIQFDKNTNTITYVGYTQMENVPIDGHYGYYVFKNVNKRIQSGYDRKNNKPNTEHQKQLKKQQSSLRTVPFFSINGYLSRHQALQIESLLIHYFDPLCNSFDSLMEYKKNENISYYILNILKSFENPSFPIGFIYSCMSSDDNKKKYVGKNIKSIPFEQILRDDVKLNDFTDVGKLVELHESLTTRHYTSNRANSKNMKYHNVDNQVCLMLVVPCSRNIFLYKSLFCSMETIWMHQLNTLQYVKWNNNYNNYNKSKYNKEDNDDKLNQIASINLWNIAKTLNKKAVCDSCGYQMINGYYSCHFNENDKCKFMYELRCKEFGCYEKFNVEKELNDHQKQHQKVDRLEKANKSDWKVTDQRHCHLRLGNKICRALRNNVHNMMNSHKYRIHGIDYQTRHICTGCNKKCPSLSNLKHHQNDAICNFEDCQIHFDVNHVGLHKHYCGLIHCLLHVL